MLLAENCGRSGSSGIEPGPPWDVERRRMSLSASTSLRISSSDGSWIMLFALAAAACYASFPTNRLAAEYPWSVSFIYPGAGLLCTWEWSDFDCEWRSIRLQREAALPLFTARGLIAGLRPHAWRCARGEAACWRAMRLEVMPRERMTANLVAEGDARRLLDAIDSNTGAISMRSSRLSFHVQLFIDPEGRP